MEQVKNDFVGRKGNAYSMALAKLPGFIVRDHKPFAVLQSQPVGLDPQRPAPRHPNHPSHAYVSVRYSPELYQELVVNKSQEMMRGHASDPRFAIET